jgi:hypothetical protein
LPFRKIDPKAHELHLIDRNQVSQRSKADIPLLWLNHMQFQETERIPAGYFFRHLPQCLMQSKSLPDATGTLTRTSRRRDNFGWPGIVLIETQDDAALFANEQDEDGVRYASRIHIWLELNAGDALNAKRPRICISPSSKHHRRS